MPIWPNDPGISMELTRSTDRGDNVNVTRLNMGVNTGTHIDAPFHFEPDEATNDQLSQFLDNPPGGVIPYPVDELEVKNLLPQISSKLISDLSMR